MKKLLATLLFFVFLYEAHSSHMRGGSIIWECINSGQDKGKFIFKTSVYGRCEGDLGTSISINNGLYTKWGGPALIYTSRDYLELMDTLCSPAFSQLACTSTGGNVSIMNVEHYKSVPIKILGVPDTNGSDFWWTRYTRVPASMVKNMNGQNYYIRASMYPYLNASTNNYDTLGTKQFPSCYDNSPQFAEAPFYIRCINVNNKLNFGSTDFDGDSLVYNWTNPMVSSTQSVSWRTGFGTFNQFPDSNFSASNNAAILDQKSGIVAFKTDTPFFLLTTSVEVVSYRNGQKIAAIYRDCNVELINCKFPLPVTDPTISYKLPSSSTFQPNISLLRQVGDTIEMDIRSTDLGIKSINPVVLQSPNLEIYGSSCSTEPNAVSNCASPPCAFLDSVGNSSWNGAKFIGTSNVMARFVWPTTCVNLKNSSGTQTFNFYVKSQDDHCMLPGTGYATFNITLIDTINSITKLKQLNIKDSTIFLEWNAVSSSSFLSYQINSSAYPSGPWTNIHTNSNINTTDYSDTPSGNIKTPIYYKIVTNTGMFCSNENTVYRPVIMKKTVNKSRVRLTWNIPFVDSLNFRYGKYYIQRKDSNGAWYNSDTVNNMTYSYLNRSAGHGYTSYFRIKADNREGFTAISNIDSVYFPLLKPIPNYPVGSGSIDTSKVGVGVTTFDRKEWKIYPNPFNQYVIIEANGLQESTELNVFDVKGNIVVFRNIVAGRNVVDTKSLSKGLYYFTYRNAEGEMHSERVVKVE